MLFSTILVSIMKTFDVKSSVPLIRSPTTSNSPATVSSINRSSTLRGGIKVVAPPSIPISSDDANNPKDVIKCKQQLSATLRQLSEEGRACPMQLIPEQMPVLMFHNANHNQEEHNHELSCASLLTTTSETLDYRYSSSSLDSGRGSDSLKLTVSAGAAGDNRVSVHSVESIGSISSAKDWEASQQSSLSSSSSSSTSSSFCSSSSSSSSLSYHQHPAHFNRTLVSAADTSTVNHNNTRPAKFKNVFKKMKSTSDNHKANKAKAKAEVEHKVEHKMDNQIPSIAEMILYGVSDTEIIHNWLAKIGMGVYEKHFLDAAYDMATISKMNPQDLTAIGITDPNARSTLTIEIQKLNIDEGLPSFKPETLQEWLKLLNLSCYYETLCEQNYNTIDKVTQLTWEDLEDVGVSKLGHQKKILLAIKKIKSLAKNEASGGEPLYGTTSSPYTKPIQSPSCNNFVPPNVSNKNKSNTPERPSNLMSQPYPTSYQDVSIKINNLNSPTTGEPRLMEPLPVIINNGQTRFFEPRASPLRTFQQQQQLPYHPRLVPNTAYCPGPLPPPIIHHNGLSLRGRSLENLTATDVNYYNQVYMNTPSMLVANSMASGLQYPQYSNSDLYSLVNRQTGQTHQMNTFMNVPQAYQQQHQQSMNNFELDGTATLNRPRSLKPMARIMNMDNLDAASIKSNESNSTLSTISNDRGGADLGSETSSIYGGTKKNPPPPPKRVNSVKKAASNSVPSTPVHQPNNMFHGGGGGFFDNHNAYDDIGVFSSYTSEDLFASCVKSLTNKFSEMHSLSPQSDQPKSVADVDGGKQIATESNCKTLPMNKKDRRQHHANGNVCADVINASSSSSTESMPFANDNIGTIRQKNSLFMQSAMRMFDTGSKGSCSSSSSSSSTSSPMYNTNKSIANSLVGHEVSPSAFPPPPPSIQQTMEDEKSRQNVVDSLEDIELMLANLKTQLDSIE